MDTISVFDNLEMDTTHLRVASRRALALAHNRVERNLGRFLRAARSEDEFLERLGLLQDEFAGYVTTASAECGHEHPEAIASALRDHYRLAAVAKGVEFEETPEEKQEEEEQEKTSYVRTWKQANPLGQPPTGPQSAPTALAPGGAPPALPMDPAMQMQAPGAPGAPQPGVPGQGVPPQAPGAQAQVPGVQPPVDPMLLHGGHKQGSPLGPSGPGGPQDPWGGADMKGFMKENPGGQGICPRCHAPLNDIGDCYECGYQDVPSPYDEFGRSREPAPEEEQGYGGGFPSGHMAAAQNPADQNDDSSRLVTCPECGGDGKTAGATKCAKCAGKGKVPNFGDPIAQAYTSRRWVVSEEGNTDLGGPSPKMDKGQGPGSKPDVPGQFVEKDPVEPIKATNEGELKEIGDIEHVSLPTQTGDTPYATGGEDSGPHTDTFGNDGQADPVTHETVESSHNPLSELLTSEFPPDAVVNEALLQLDK